MSDRPDDGDVLPATADAAAPAPPPRWPYTPPLSWPFKSIRVSRVFLGVIGALLLVVTVQDVRLVRPDAAQVCILMPNEGDPLCGGTNRVLYLNITNAATAADLYARINRLPVQWSPPNQPCPAVPASSNVLIRFTLWNLPVETATTNLFPFGAGDPCHRWWLSPGNIPEPFARVGAGKDGAVILCDLLGGIPYPQIPCEAASPGGASQ